MQHFQRFLYLCALIVALLNAAILMSTGKKLPYFSEDALTKCSVHGDHPKITVIVKYNSIFVAATGVEPVTAGNEPAEIPFLYTAILRSFYYE